ncbi:MAG: tyrosine--tRNA ligase [Actinobacteria bacterium]|uniref:tyrosine--tRNA ligase n=1 Tax=freshwater metagenome TaxID=449393 RepID=A0A6J7JC77_9ZZZZ|nr:tyrosine--tRNA ligase [Actinomycetota bacterium]
MSAILDDLQARDLIAQSTDLEALRRDLEAAPMTLYCGFDPTAPSLHLGNLAQILTVRRFQLDGHRPLALVGGATGLIGDPKMAGERTLNDSDTVAAWVDGIRAQLERFYDFDGSNAAIVVNNLDWTAPVTAIEFLRDIGKHFSVNRMLDREAVAARLAGPGISYTEFSYALLQSYDFLELFRRHGCMLQTGGSDQWGNITAGVDLVRRVEGAHVHALTTPLITKADGTKFGKTESGTIWLDPQLTTPYAFHQFWINADDRDVSTLMRTYSFKPIDEIVKLEQLTAEKPAERAAQRALADEITTLVHGASETRAAEAAAAALFGRGDLADLPEPTLAAALTEAGVGLVEASEVIAGMLPALSDLLVRCGLAASKGAARRTVAEGGVSINNVRSEVDSADAPIDASLLLHGHWLVLRRGRRSVAGVRIA